jgi:hypothetical protein
VNGGCDREVSTYKVFAALTRRRSRSVEHQEIKRNAIGALKTALENRRFRAHIPKWRQLSDAIAAPRYKRTETKFWYRTPVTHPVVCGATLESCWKARTFQHSS